jgi:DNA repair protein RadA/Sms
LAEIQGLVTNSGFNTARRNSNGVDRNRAMMLLAVLEKRGGLPISTYDSYINVVGGLTVEEPAADLAMLLAVASSYYDMPLGTDLAAVGEVGLSGEIRSVMHLNQRLIETARLGFKRCVIPVKTGKDDIKVPKGLKLIQVNNIREAIKAVFGE